MILVDSSVWISYYRPEGRRRLKEVVKEAISHNLVATNGIIIVEVLNGISREQDYRRVKSHLEGFHYLPLTEEDFYEASLLGSSLRRNGVSIPPTDIIIAFSAIKGNAMLYHLDNHFELIARHIPLKTRMLG
jgi:hypothetical protein